jgi:hypothetical protein
VGWVDCGEVSVWGVGEEGRWLSGGWEGAFELFHAISIDRHTAAFWELNPTKKLESAGSMTKRSEFSNWFRRSSSETRLRSEFSNGYDGAAQTVRIFLPRKVLHSVRLYLVC